MVWFHDRVPPRGVDNSPFTLRHQLPKLTCLCPPRGRSIANFRAPWRNRDIRAHPVLVSGSVVCHNATPRVPRRPELLSGSLRRRGLHFGLDINLSSSFFCGLVGLELDLGRSYYVIICIVWFDFSKYHPNDNYIFNIFYFFNFLIFNFFIKIMRPLIILTIYFNCCSLRRCLIVYFE